MKNDELQNLIGAAVGNAVGEKFELLIRALIGEKESRYMLYSWLDFWYREFKVKHIPPLSDNGLYQIRNCIDTHIKPHFEDKPLNKLTAFDCQQGITAIPSTRMAVYAYDTLNDSLNKAVIFGELKTNPLLKVDKPKHKRAKKMPLTHEQERQFLRYIKGNRLENLFLFYLVSGCRKLEAVNIRWSDVDWNNNRLFVDGTKTPCSKRYIPLFDDIKIILKRQPQTSVYVFPYEDYTIKNTWRWLCKKHEDINYSIHSLRHTFATRCYERKVSDKVIQKWLGHSRVSVTQDIYIDVLEDFEKEEFDKVNSIRKVLKERGQK